MRKIYQESFVKRLVLQISVFNVIMVIAFSLMTYSLTKTNTTSNMDETIATISNVSAATVEDFVSDATGPLKYISSSELIISYMSGSSSDSNDVYNMLLAAASSSDDVLAMWCINEDGDTFVGTDGTEMNVELSQCSWYEDFKYMSIPTHIYYAVNSDTTVFYSSNVDILVVYPVVVDNRTLGYIGAEVSTKSLANSVLNTSLNGVYAFLYTDDGDVLVSTEGSMKVIGDNLSKVKQSSDGYGTYAEIDNMYYTKTAIKGVDLTLVVLFEKESVSSTFNRLITQQIIILICLFVLEIVATINVIRHESKDIPSISGSIAEISAGNYNFRINSASKNEIGMIANSVDAMAKALQDKNAVIDDYAKLDPTTGLQNKYRMYDKIDDLIISRDETRPRFALLFIDIDNFKWTTETLGHRHGDVFLRIFGQRLKEVTKDVYRFSGDEFVVLMNLMHPDDDDEIDEMIAKLKAKFIEPIEVLHNKLYAKFSVGVSIFPTDETNADLLLRDGNIAVSRAKEKGKERVSYYNSSQHKSLLNKTTIVRELEHALENGELFLNYQPIIAVDGGAIHGFEALLRWESSELGYMSPVNFVHIAEETGAIVKIGQWIFETACRRLKIMNEYNSEIVMSVNVSPVQMKDPDFLDNIKRAIKITGVNPKNIQIEITEGSLVDDKIAGPIITALNDMGMALALDDFGTGYSSMQYLKDYPIKTLKVDKSFVDEICNKHKDYRITGSIIDMVRGLNIKTVVEGVESIDQYNILVEMKCDYIQGFLMSKPLSEKDSLEFVVKYDELHKPNAEMLEHNSNVLAEEKLERQMKGDAE